jgi:hypothetical protein
MMSAAASLGLSLLWDTDGGLSHVDKYTYSSEEHIKVSTAYFTLRATRLMPVSTSPAPCSLLASCTQESEMIPTPLEHSWWII